jgi:hypothetical protein
MWRRLYDKIYDKISQKADPSIVSFEKMLGINIDETFNINLELENRDE